MIPARSRSSAEELQAEAEKLTDRMQKEVLKVKVQMEQLELDRAALEEEKRKMSAFANEEQATATVVEINVGGEVMATRRGTLTLAEGTLLEAIFSGRWEESLARDAAGRVFLDYSPVVFRTLLSQLRARRDARPGQVFKNPVVPPEYRDEFESMVHFLELSEFIYGRKEEAAPQAASPGSLVCALSTAVSPYPGFTISDNVVATGEGWHYAPVIGRTPLLDASRQSATWKVTVLRLASEGWICAGIIGEAAPPPKSHLRPTSYGWAGSDLIWRGGEQLPLAGGEWWTWQQGDVAVLQLEAKPPRLRLFHRRLRSTFSLLLPSGAAARQMRAHANLYAASSSIQVEAASNGDLADAAFA